MIFNITSEQSAISSLKDGTTETIDIFSVDVPQALSLMMTVGTSTTMTCKEWPTFFQYGKYLWMKAGRILEALDIFEKLLTAIQQSGLLLVGTSHPAGFVKVGSGSHNTQPQPPAFHIYCHSLVGAIKCHMALQDKKALEKFIQEQISPQLQERMFNEMSQVAFHSFLGQVYFFYSGGGTIKDDNLVLAKKHLVKSLFLDPLVGYDAWCFLSDFHLLSLMELRDIFQRLLLKFGNSFQVIEPFYRSKIEPLTSLSHTESCLLIVNQVLYSYSQYDYQTCINLLKKYAYLIICPVLSSHLLVFFA